MVAFVEILAPLRRRDHRCEHETRSEPHHSELREAREPARATGGPRQQEARRERGKQGHDRETNALRRHGQDDRGDVEPEQRRNFRRSPEIDPGAHAGTKEQQRKQARQPQHADQREAGQRPAEHRQVARIPLEEVIVRHLVAAERQPQLVPQDASVLERMLHDRVESRVHPERARLRRVELAARATARLATPVTGFVFGNSSYPVELLREPVGVVEVVATIEVRARAARRQHESPADMLVAQRDRREHQRGAEDKAAAVRENARVPAPSHQGAPDRPGGQHGKEHEQIAAQQRSGRRQRSQTEPARGRRLLLARSHDSERERDERQHEQVLLQQQRREPDRRPVQRHQQPRDPAGA